MTFLAKSLQGVDVHRLQQIVKWTVYTLLIVNFGFYIWEDVNRAIHTLHAASTLFDWTTEFATTIDTLAWFTLLLMFELETYLLDDAQWKRWVERTVHGLRLLCYAMLLHTVVAYGDTVRKYTPTLPVTNAAELCDLADDGVSFVYNLEYTEVTADNCSTLSGESEFFKLGSKDPLVSTFAGLELARDLAWADMIEVLVWLVIVLSIEKVVRLQGRGVTGGRLMSTLNVAKLVSYGILFVLAVYWAGLGHWLYTWDTFLWVAGFAVIEMNVSEWRDELLGEQSADQATAAVPE
ncbi:MAG: hypothetical protein AAGE85_00770 [Pseudomonadota bacterium]